MMTFPSGKGSTWLWKRGITTVSFTDCVTMVEKEVGLNLNVAQG